jgi:hypothetical protein
MEKSRKLRRYNRKDYAQVVDFPVEIVGRDGVVRRYTFEESVRLYQRRIASANLRYEDGEVVQAEVQHCRRRIDQLRRSYFSRYGWSSIRAVEGSEELSGELAGEIVAFLRRSLPAVEPEALQLHMLDQQGGQQLFSVRAHGEDALREQNYLLYLYSFESEGKAPQKEAFFTFLKVLQGVRMATEGVEVLMTFHQSADCGLILTGRAGEVAATDVEDAGVDAEVGGDGPWMEPAEEADPLRDGLSQLRQGHAEDALAWFTSAYEGNHYRRAAYLWASLVADQLGLFPTAETAALMGSRYFPSDPLLAFHLTVARLRQGDLEAASASLPLARELTHGLGSVALAAALLNLRRGDLSAARRDLSQARRLRSSEQPALTAGVRLLTVTLAARAVSLAAASFVLVVGVVALFDGRLGGLALVVGGLALILALRSLFRMRWRALAGLPGQRGLLLLDPYVLQRPLELGPKPQ